MRGLILYYIRKENFTEDRFFFVTLGYWARVLLCTEMVSPSGPRERIRFPFWICPCSSSLYRWNSQTTRYPKKKKRVQNVCIAWHETSYKTNVVLAWKLSKARAGMLSSNSLIMSHGPSPTPTRIIDNGYWLQKLLFYHVNKLSGRKRRMEKRAQWNGETIMIFLTLPLRWLRRFSSLEGLAGHDPCRYFLSPERPTVIFIIHSRLDIF